MSLKSFEKFMKIEQKDNRSSEVLVKIIESFESSDIKSSFSREGFGNFLMFNEEMEILSPDTRNRVKGRKNIHYYFIFN